MDVTARTLQGGDGMLKDKLALSQLTGKDGEIIRAFLDGYERGKADAQPERIVRCKDCKHWIPYDWMFSEVWQSRNINDYPEDEIGCNLCDVAMKANDFCSRGERSEVTE